MTEVNCSNYQTIFPEIIAKIQDCTFVAIDTEFTGLSSANPKYRRSLFDTGAERYANLRESHNGSNYLISQFGLGIFTKTNSWDENEWTLEAYNIYLFPPSIKNWNQNFVFEVQVSSLNFLSQYQFDFNKFIREGAPYLRPDQEIELLNEFPGRQGEEFIKKLRGFTKVLDAIRVFEKPLVGHNCLLDLLLIMKQFYQPLPETYEEFKETIIQIFPIIYDTKYMSHSIEKFLIQTGRTDYCDFKVLFNSGLYELYKNINGIRDILSPIITVRPGGTSKYEPQLKNPSEEEDLEAFHHEAGLDACLTGAIFLQLAHISFRSLVVHQNTFSLKPPSITEMFMNIQTMANRIIMLRCTIPWTNLTGPDPKSTRPPWITFQMPDSEDPFLETLKHLVTVVLPKYGDFETKIDEDTNEMLIACGTKNCHERSSEELRMQGLELYMTPVPDDGEAKNVKKMGKHRLGSLKKKVVLSGIAILSVVLVFRQLRQ